MAKNLSNLRAPKKANTERKRVGRGMGSGMGKTSTRGHKGQRSRSGSHMMRGFEGGQMPLHRRLPKRGFTNIFRTEYSVVNLDRIAELEGVKEIGLDDYVRLGLASSKKALIKILGAGELTSAITIHAHKFSKSAQEKIEKAGGKAVLPVPDAGCRRGVKRGPRFFCIQIGASQTAGRDKFTGPRVKWMHTHKSGAPAPEGTSRTWLRSF